MCVCVCVCVCVCEFSWLFFACLPNFESLLKNLVLFIFFSFFIWYFERTWNLRDQYASDTIFSGRIKRIASTVHFVDSALKKKKRNAAKCIFIFIFIYLFIFFFFVIAFFLFKYIFADRK